MGSSTVRYLWRFAFCLFMAVGFTSCEDGGDSTAETGGALGSHQFATEAHLRFVHPLTGQPVSSPVVFLSEQEHKELRARQVNREEVRAQGVVLPLGFTQLLDVDIEQAYGLSTARSIPVHSNHPDSLPSHKSATAARFADDPVFTGVYFTATGSGIAAAGPSKLASPYIGTAYRECTWTLPANSGSGSHLLVVGNPNEALAPISMEVGGRIALRTEIVGNVPADWIWSIWLNGQLISSGSKPASSQIPVLADPILQSTASGEFQVTATTHREDPRFPNSTIHGEYAGHYRQRRLTLDQSFPIFSPDQTQAVPIRNTMIWTDGGAVENPGWEILDENDQILAQGTSTVIDATWDPSGAVQDSFASVPVRIRLKSLAYHKEEMFFHGSFGYPTRDVDYEIVEDFGPPGELKIVNIALDPNPPFQNEGDTVHLTAEILAVGLGDLTTEDITWWVDLIGPDGSVVGEPLATGDGFEVAATWDGKIAGVAVEDPLSYKLRITAVTNCDTPSPQRSGIRAQALGCKLARADAELPSGPRLEVLEGDKVLAKGFASPTESEADKRRELLGLVRQLEWRGDNPTTLKVRASGLSFTDIEGNELPPPDELNFQVRSLVSGVTLPAADQSLRLTLEKVEETTPRAYTFSASFRLDPSLIKTGDELGQTRYSIGEAYEDSSSPALSDKELRPAVVRMLQTTGFYPAEHTFLGSFEESAVEAKHLAIGYPAGETAPDQVTSAVDNILSTGFEAIEFKLIDDRFALFQSATVKVAQPATLMVLNFHGGHDGTLGLSTDRDQLNPPPRLDWFLRPSLTLANHFSGVKTLILPSCDILDIGDYNNNFAAPIQGVWPAGVDRLFGGNRWDDMTGNGARGTVVLGYNAPAPGATGEDVPELLRQNLAARIMDLYSQRLRDFRTDSRVPEGSKEQWAWMAANVDFAQTARDVNDIRWLALNASALDPQFYYYIPHEVGLKRKVNFGVGVRRPPREPDLSSVDGSHPVYRVPRLLWNEASGDWHENQVDLADFVPIPDLTYTPPNPNP